MEHKTGISGQRSGRALIILFLLVLCLLPAHKAAAGQVGAKAALVLDSDKGRILFAKNPNARLAPASTTKVVTAMVVLDRLHPDTVVTVSKRAAKTPSVSPHLIPGDRLTVQDLLYMALMRSVNGAAVALAEAAAGSEDRFAEMMNDKVSRLGLKNTQFINSSGLPGPGSQYTTAYELSIVMKTALRYPIIREIINTRTKDIYTVEGRRLFFKNTNELLWSDDEVLGGKTGYTRAAGHCLVCVGEKEEATLITVLLGERVRGRLWDDTSFLLSRGGDILADKAEPLIYFSPIQKSSVSTSSRKGKTGSRKSQLAKTTKKRGKSSSVAQAKKKSKRAKTLAKKKRKRAVFVSNKKTKKPAGQRLSVRNKADDDRS